MENQMYEKLLTAIPEQLLSKLELANNYWLIRTDGGKFFEDFTTNNFVSIGWPEIPAIDVNNPDKLLADVDSFVKKYHGELPEKQFKQKATYIKNQITIFESKIQIGDFVVIPSANSSRIGIGKIVNKGGDLVRKDGKYLTQDISRMQSVKWIKFINRCDLDLKFDRVFFNHQTIVKVNKYADCINKALYSLYEWDDTLNFVVTVTKESDIPAKDFYNFSVILEIAERIGAMYNVNLVDSLIIKTRVQSKGDLVYSVKSTEKNVRLALAALVIFVSACTKDMDLPNDYSSGKEINAEYITEVKSNNTELDPLMKKMNESFNKLN